MSPARIAALAALAAFGISCRSGPPPAIDPSLAAVVPAAATILAGVNLEHVRTSPLLRQLPAAALALFESWKSARSVVAASDGGRYLIVARGDFQLAPPGTTLLSKGLAAAGSADWLSAAGRGHDGRNALLAPAEAIAETDLWMVASGNANLPVTGNGENLNRLLHSTQYTTLTVRLTGSVAIDATGVCSRPEPARHLEETVRAFLSLGAGATAARQPALAALLRRIRVTRDDRTVHVTLTAQANELEAVLKALGVG